MGRKMAAVLFGALLFLAGAVPCIKPLCTNAVREAFLSRAVAFRVNDVIWDWYSDEDLDRAVEIQEMIKEHPQLNRVAAKYLDALVRYRNLGGNFREPDVSGNLQKMNEDILRRLESEFGEKMTAEGRQVFLNELHQVEWETVEILNELPYYIRNFGEPAWIALGLYGAWTSWPFFLALVVLLVWLGWYRLRKEEMTKWLQHTAILFLADGLLLGLIVPAMIRAVSYRVANRVIGRAQMADTSVFLYTGIVFVLLATGMLAARKIIMTKERKGIQEYGEG